jgi:hypothetical protein
VPTGTPADRWARRHFWRRSNRISGGCLHDLSSFGARQWILVEITDDRGRRYYGSTLIVALQSSFPFMQVFTPEGPELTRLSENAIDALRDYCSRTTLPDVKYELRSELTPIANAALLNPRTLPKGWLAVVERVAK